MRDVIDHRVSQWGQYVKRVGACLDLNTFLLTKKYDVLDYVLKWKNISNEFGFKLTLRNYSKCKNFLAQDFFVNVLKQPVLFDNLSMPSKRVNRSLSFPELEVQRVFNAAYGRSSSLFISDFLCENFPHVKPWRPIVAEQVYEHIVNENIKNLEVVNSLCADSMQLEIGSKEKWVNAKEEGLSSIEYSMIEKLGRRIEESFTP